MFEAMAHQKRAIPSMVKGNHFLVWDPGTGKTYPVLVASQYVNGPTLCIVPAHLREQWAEEARKHAPLAVVQVLADTTKKWTWQFQDIVIVSYEYVSHPKRWKELRLTTWGAIAIDEAHYLMNGDANRTRAILGSKPLTEEHGLVFAADCVWSLTGTPFTFPNQIYPLLAALFPEALTRPERNGEGLMTSREWENEFCIVAPDKNGFGEKIVGAKNIPELRRRLAPFLDKVKLEEAVDMKGLTVDTIPIRGTLSKITQGLDPDLLAQYEALTEILLDERIPDMEKLAAIEEGGLVMAQLRHTIAVAKIKPTLEIIKNELASGVKKILVFGWHKEPLKALAKELDAPIIYGDISKRLRAEAKDEFINDERCQVLVGQISSIGTGTDGLQEVCHRSLFMEASWAYRDNKQCLHRTYRKGQRFPCHASFITLLGSVDEYVAKVLKRNAEIVGKSLD